MKENGRKEGCGGRRTGKDLFGQTNKRGVGSVDRTLVAPEHVNFCFEVEPPPSLIPFFPSPPLLILNELPFFWALLCNAQWGRPPHNRLLSFTDSALPGMSSLSGRAAYPLAGGWGDRGSFSHVLYDVLSWSAQVLLPRCATAFPFLADEYAIV